MSYQLPEKFTAPYDPSLTEQRIYKLWDASGYFNPDKLPDAEKRTPWCTIMPPPNANGRLHAGHGLDMTLKDIATRWKRMQGYRALFLPGADHAGFETQIVYEKKLSKEGRSRFQMTPDELYAEILAFTLENKKYMEDDVRRLGASCDWSREKFTLDPDVIDQVHTTFIKMYHDGLVYRGKRSINWCSKHQTSLSDVETEFIDKKDPFYYFHYGPFVIGTARPETKFADKYVVVHPDDPRYSDYTHMQSMQAEWINGPITLTVIKDVAANMEMGTGAMTITPWHSAIDFELAQKYNLDIEQIIDEMGKLLPIAGEFEGMKIEEARPKIVEKLREKGLVARIDENYQHAIRTCYKCATVIEPHVKDQWFVKMEPLAKLALEAIDTGTVTFLTEQFEKTFRHWMNNPMDWNISRQIVWGIGIPAWFKNKGTDHEEIYVDTDTPDGEGWEKETDTFDTWFSSGQWPMLTLGFPDGADFANYYPTDLMQTGRDLIFKWIPRMVMFGMYLTGKQPFDLVYLHGMINDEQNQKMSKSKGNVLSPIDLADEFGADALRMSLVVGNTPGNDMALSKEKIKAYKKFANKLWNISRFVLAHFEKNETLPPSTSILDHHQTHLDRIHQVGKEVTELMESYKFYLAAEKIYHYTWHECADTIIESLKVDLASEDTTLRDSAHATLAIILDNCLRYLHPFMPFITEEIWQEFPTPWRESRGTMLMTASWPTPSSPQ